MDDEKIDVNEGSRSERYKKIKAKLKQKEVKDLTDFIDRKVPSSDRMNQITREVKKEYNK